MRQEIWLLGGKLKMISSFFFFKQKNHGYLSKRFSNCIQAYKTNKTKIKFLSHKLRTNRAHETQIELQYLMMPRK
jgi:hypothetical protein